MNFPDIISGIGVLFILIPFFLATFNKLNDKSVMYFSLNLFGGSFAFWGSLLVNSIPFAVLEGTWTLVAVAGLYRAIRKS